MSTRSSDSSRIVVGLAEPYLSDLRESDTYEALDLRQLAETFQLDAVRDALMVDERLAGPSLDGLCGFYAIETSSLGQADAESLLKTLQTAHGVAAAYFEPVFVRRGPPSRARTVDAKTPSQNGNRPRAHQPYLHPKPTGVGLLDVDGSLLSGYDGRGFQFVDIEHGWIIENVAFNERRRRELAEFENPRPSYHGTAVLALILADPESSPFVGIARGAGVARLVSVWNKLETELAPAIVNAAGCLAPGDVMLIEVATPAGNPIESWPASFNAIQIATAKGIIVIEAAGNRRWDLSGVASPEWNGAGRQYEGVADSGAIIVGACDSEVEGAGDQRHHAVLSTSNFGQRVDCYAWGAHVETAWGDPENEHATGTLAETSASAAIIAGLALVIQQRAIESRAKLFDDPAEQREVDRRGLSPYQMRALLRNPACGTPVTCDGAPVGSMPDLGLVFEAMQSLPELHLRQSRAHGLLTFGNDEFLKTPDILVADPLETALIDDAYDVALSLAVDPHAWVRLRNVGPGVGREIDASVYWRRRPDKPTESSAWEYCGSCRRDALPPGKSLVVGPVRLGLPLLDSGSVIDVLALVSASGDPCPELPSATGMHGIKRILNGYNNAAARTFRTL